MIFHLLKNISVSILLLLLHIENASSKYLNKEDLPVLLELQSNSNLQQSKQFVGTSIIGGLMWPVLLTLTFTAIMARVPDALQRLLTGTGSKYRNTNHQRIGSKDSEYLDSLVKTLLTAIDTVDNMKFTTFRRR